MQRRYYTKFFSTFEQGVEELALLCEFAKSSIAGALHTSGPVRADEQTIRLALRVKVEKKVKWDDHTNFKLIPNGFFFRTQNGYLYGWYMERCGTRFFAGIRLRSNGTYDEVTTKRLLDNGWQDNQGEPSKMGDFWNTRRVPLHYLKTQRPPS